MTLFFVSLFDLLLTSHVIKLINLKCAPLLGDNVLARV